MHVSSSYSIVFAATPVEYGCQKLAIPEPHRGKHAESDEGTIDAGIEQQQEEIFVVPGRSQHFRLQAYWIQLRAEAEALPTTATFNHLQAK